MWTLDDAIELVRSIRLPLKEVGWACAVGGGVIWRGHSEHDLDLVIVPYDQTNCDHDHVVAVLTGLGWERYCTVEEMHAYWRTKGLTDDKHVEAWRIGDKRVDIISPATRLDRRLTQ